MSNVPLIHVEDLKQRMDANTAPFLLDVREPNEYAICNLGGLLIPLNDLPRRVAELDPQRETVVHCRSGSRSAMAVEFLIANGFKNVKNLAGGILAWSAKIDPSMPQY
jgi:rhodanese-related sulfurtransferase